MRRLARGVAVFLVLPLGGCFEGSAEPASPPPPIVRVATVEATDGTAVRRFVGRIEAVRTVDLAFEVPGTLLANTALQGTRLPAGTVLAALDPEGYAIERRRAEASLQLARLELERAQDLVRRGVAAQARLDEARASFALAQATFAAAARNVSLTTVEAPFEVLVARRLVEPFAFVQPGMPVLRVQDVSELRVVFSVPERLLGHLDVASDIDAVARIAALDGSSMPLEFRERVTEANAVAQTYDVVFAVVDPPAALLPGMTAVVELALPSSGAPGLPRVPLAAVDTGAGEGPRLWVYDDGTGTVAPRSVRLGLVEGGAVQIAEGVEPMERIVVAGVNRLAPGQVVRASLR